MQSRKLEVYKEGMTGVCLMDRVNENTVFLVDTDKQAIRILENGEAGNQCALRRQWVKLKQERGFDDRIKLYSLRHTYVSIVSAQSMISEGNLKQILGHSKSMDTFGVYGHRVDSELENTASVIDLTFGKYRNSM